MKLKPIINTLLATDLYKFNMGAVISRKFSDYTTTWTFNCRNKDVFFTPEMVDEIRSQIDHYCTLSFDKDELAWIEANIPWLNKGYVNYLKMWRPDRSEILVNEGGIVPYNECGLAIEARGTWLSTSMYEIAILAIVSEVYYSFRYGEGYFNDVFKANTERKFDLVENGVFRVGSFAEFGMRRRYSTETQDWLVGHIKERGISGFVGTSNVALARKYGVKPIGTMAHEFVQCVGQGNRIYNPAYSNRLAMEAWVEEYQTRNGIMLGDTVRTECFLRDFGLTYATLFSGVRHDSGDPYLWGRRMLEHYEKLGIDARQKTLLFSDSLNFEKATNIRSTFANRCHVAFGIGTYLTCDIGANPLNIVMKVTECNGCPVAKVSDCAGKTMCRDLEYVSYLNRTIEWRLNNENANV